MRTGTSLMPALAAGLFGLVMTACTSLPNAPGSAVSPADARTIAKEAWLYGYAPIQGYQTFYNQALNTQAPGYVGGLNTFRHYSRTYTPQDAEIVTPNNDTPYSWAWLDLRAEPIVLSLPSVPAPRYYVNQWFDLYTHNCAYTGVRATGREPGNYLFAGPNWKGNVPPGITRVYRAETEIVGTLTRTQLNGPADVSTLQALQALAPARLHWFECPIAETHAHWAATRRLRAAANAQGVLLAAAETQVGLAAFQTLFDEGLYDVFMPDVKYCGGPWEMLRIAERAAAQGVQFSPHNPSGPVCSWHSLLVAAVAPVCDMLEIQFDESPLYDALQAGPSLPMEDGQLPVPVQAGSVLGVQPALLAAHPYQAVPPGIETLLNR